ncbi:hypothetical protein BJX64DRAFT_286678 [Aspergillus heterothallicus]
MAHALRKKPKVTKKPLHERLKIPNDSSTPQKADNATDSPSQLVEEATLSPIEVHIHWDRSRGSLDDTLRAASEKGINIPSQNMRFIQDPRLVTSIFAFKDSIRRMYNCQDIGMDIESLRLQHSSPYGEVESDILTHPWDETLDIFKDLYLPCYVSVVFTPVDEPEESIYESFEAPPELRTFFDLQGSNVKLNSFRIGKRTAKFSKYFFESDLDPVEEIGNAPKPKIFGSKQDQLRYYSGFNVDNEDERRKWQKRLLANLSKNATAARLKPNVLPSELTAGQKTSILTAQDQIHRNAIEKEAFTKTEENRISESDYCVLQQACSGTDNRCGPPIDLCMQLLMATKKENGLYKSELLEKFIDTHFYHYQISGAVGVLLKLYGHIDPELLLLATDCLQHPQANMVREAAARLKDLCLHGAILADETGFGKTKQSLLVAVLHGILYTEKDTEGNNCYRPALLVVPPTLITQWLAEIHDHWPCLIPVLSYDDPAFRMAMDLSVIPPAAMRAFPDVALLPEHLRFIFDKHNEKARRVIIITSYATHRHRAGRVEESRTPGKIYDPPQFDPVTEKQVYMERPHTQTVWKTSFRGIFSLLIADEAQKVKNPQTSTWAVLRVHEFPRILLTTATPMFNAAKDLVGLVGLLWPAARKILRSYLDGHPEGAEMHEKIQNMSTEGIATVVPGLDPLCPVRIEIMNAQTLQRMFKRESSLHLRVAARFQDMLDMISIQRSQGSTLPNESGEPIKLKLLFKPVSYKTATVSLPPTEELEYQLWHRAGADEFAADVNKAKQKRGDILVPDGPVPTHSHLSQAQQSFMAAPRALRKLGIANFGTKMARLNAVMESVNGNTHVDTVRDWREKGLDAQFLYDLTRGEGETAAQTADSLISYLTEGSSVIRLVFQELLTMKVVERVNKTAFGHHQKIIVGETLPANAFYLQQVLRACLIDARVFHADLSHQAKTNMVDLFNDEYSTFKVLIMLYDVGAVGLNLHKACNRVIIASLPRSRAQESQLAGRALRITSEFPLTVVRRVTPNSHDQYRGTRQAEKAALQLAANACDPSITQLLVKLLNEFQKEVDQFHLQRKLTGVKAVVPNEGKPRTPSRAGNRKATPAKNRVTVKSKKQTSAPSTNHASTTPSRNLRERTRRSAYKGNEDDDVLFVQDNDPEYIDAGEESSNDEYEHIDEGLSESDTSSAQDEDDEDISDVNVSLLDDRPNDVARHRQTLLQYAPGKVWTEKDLKSELFLILALRLLYNKISGMELLHLTRSIHIYYKQFPKKAISRANKLKKPNVDNQAKAREKGL